MADFDIAIIGAGASGLSVANVAARLGLRVALVERDRMGGDCLNTGCVPSKALLAAAHAAEAVRQVARYGVQVTPPEIDWAAVRAHVSRAVDTIAPTDSEERYRSLGVTVLRAQARFVAPNALDVGGERVMARRVVIAAGSRAAEPPIPSLANVPHLTNETLFGLTQRPEHLLILGGGAIGLEMAQAHRLLGCRVTVVEAARTIAPHDDPELAGGLRAVLLAQGVTIHEGAAVAAVEPGPVLVLQGGERIAGSHLLVAVGRQPNLEDLGLTAGGVQASTRGIVTDRGLRSVSNKRVFAVGDIADPEGVGPRALTHVGSYHAGLVIRRALFRLPSRIDYAALPRVIYTDPELAQVGLTEAEAREGGRKVEVVRWPLTENDRAIAENKTTGMVKLVLARGRIVGAGILASHAGDMIGAWTLAIGRRVPLSAMAGMMVPYPTRAEAAKRAAGTYYEPKLFGAHSKALVRFLVRLP